MRIEYHRVLLADRVRNAAFHAALQKVVVKGKTTVADIGAGTGFLGFLAARLGAKRVDLYETAEIAAIARKLLRHNRLSNCRIAQVHSTDVAEPDRVDLIVSETLGNYPFEENIIATLNDARERFLEPWRHHHSRSGRAVRLPRGRRAPVPRPGGLGRGRLRPRFRPRQGDEPQQYIRALAGAGRPARRRRGGQGLGPGALRPQEQDHPHRRGRVEGNARRHPLRPGAVVGRRPRRGRAPLHRPARPAHALGAALSARPGADRHRPRRDAARAPEIHHLVRDVAPT